MKKKEIVVEDDWKIEDAVRTMMEYQKILKDEKLKEKAIKRIKEKKAEIGDAIKDLED